MKIGIMGGTFNPIHIGHLLLGEFAYEAFNLDVIWFLPNGNPPHKDSDLMISSIDHRVEMTKLAIEDTPYFELSLHEIKKSSVSYSFETMEFFQEKYVDDTFYFIVGADSLFSMESWMQPERLFQKCTILVAYRDDKDVEEMKCKIDFLKRKYHAKIELLSAPLLEISSSIIRSRVSHNRSIRYMVPDKVQNYIQENNLYEDEKDI
ncbi:nicotinate-nucleotide adenylyltransferase [Lachnospiraceae bacterium LCP25S3_G4]